MKQKHSLITVSCIALMIVISPIANSSESEGKEAPSYYPSSFQKVGVLTEIRSQFHWVVNGVQTDVSRDVLVHSLASNFSSLYSIKQGMELGYKVNSRGVITEVWQLRKGTIRGN